MSQPPSAAASPRCARHREGRRFLTIGSGCRPRRSRSVHDERRPQEGPEPESEESLSGDYSPRNTGSMRPATREPTANRENEELRCIHADNALLLAVVARTRSLPSRSRNEESSPARGSSLIGESLPHVLAPPHRGPAAALGGWLTSHILAPRNLSTGLGSKRRDLTSAGTKPVRQPET